MKKQIKVNDSIVLDNVELVQGKETKCYHAVLLADGQRARVTYDCLNDNLVIDGWYKFDQNKLPMLTELCKACFREEVIKERMKSSSVSFHLWKKTDEYTLADEFDFLELGYIFHPIFLVSDDFYPEYNDAKETLSIIISNSDEVQPGDCLYLCRYKDGDYDKTIWEIEVLENKEIRIDDEFDYRMIRDWHDAHYGEYTKYTV